MATVCTAQSWKKFTYWGLVNAGIFYCQDIFIVEERCTHLSVYVWFKRKMKWRNVERGKARKRKKRKREDKLALSVNLIGDRRKSLKSCCSVKQKKKRLMIRQIFSVVVIFFCSLYLHNYPEWNFVVFKTDFVVVLGSMKRSVWEINKLFFFSKFGFFYLFFFVYILNFLILLFFHFSYICYIIFSWIPIWRGNP